ncbi:MAG: sugar transferase [Nocardioidaceae bacterium]
MATVTVEPDAGPTTRPRTRQQLVRVIALVALLDVAVVVAAVPAALLLRFGTELWHAPGIIGLTGEPMVDFGWVVPLWLLTLATQDAYSRRKFARGAEEFKTVLRSSITAALVGAMLCYLVNYDLSRGFYFWFFVVATALLLLERYGVSRVVARMRRHERLLHRVVLVGDTDEVAALNAALTKRPELGYTVVAVVGDPATAVEACAVNAVDTLLVASGGAGSSAGLRRIGWQLADSDIDLVVVPSLIDVAGPRIHTRPVSGLPFMHIEPPQADRAMKWGKALFDRFGALALLVLLFPLFVLIAVAVRVESRGPVLFRHCRVGAAGREFGLWKFRSMVADAEDRHAQLVETAASGVLLFKVQADPRVTRVGAFLRRYSLDELPQLFNVLRGEMSLVGPRPQVAAEVAMYVDADHRRLMVRPGLTGLWQVSGRSNLSWEESVRLDLSYVDNWSMTGDLVILFKTVRAVLRHEGAY